jgi:hypothetical protein
MLMEEKKKTLRGKLVMEHMEFPHYELESDDGHNYVLFGKLDDIDKLSNNQVEVTGRSTGGTSIHVRGISFEVESIKEVNSVF